MFYRQKDTVLRVLFVLLTGGAAYMCHANDKQNKDDASAGLAQSPLLGLQAVREPLPWFDTEKRYPAYSSDILDLKPNSTVAVTSRGRPPMPSPLSLRLSRFLYPAEDGHLDALVRFDCNLDDYPNGELSIVLLDAAQNTLSQAAVATIPGAQLHFSYKFPALMAGSSGELRVLWERPEGRHEARAAFAVAAPARPAESGRVRLSIPNAVNATLPAAPMTVGVPFPRGALTSTDNLRLVDREGHEIPLQTMETARWSRLGGVKWVLCDFNLSLDGAPREIFLEYGPEVQRKQDLPLAVDAGDGSWPRIEAGQIRLDDTGIAFAVPGANSFRTVLDREALIGAFVEHSRGANYSGWGHRYMTSMGDRFVMDDSTTFEVEENGSEKTVVRTQGWYINPETGDRFCQYVVRYVIHRDSPIIRIFHTWIFTGDGNRDTIRNMGWRFPVKDSESMGFLSSFDPDGSWLQGYYLRQQDADEYELFEYQEPPAGRRAHPDAVPAQPLKKTSTGGRAPGVMATQAQGVRLYIGVQDFWQNFPSSLMLEEDALTFYQWPRYGHPRRHPVHADDIGNVWRLWFAHEGETLNFQIPAALTEAPIYIHESGPEPHFAHGQPDSVNAQGIAKTAEMWIYLTADDVSPEQAARTLRGLHEETLRPIVDPAWITASGAFAEIAAADAEEHPELQRAYMEGVRSPLRQVERMGVYGKWIYGDLLRGADLDERTSPLYRTFRKAHWGWPFSWIPFALSGDTELLRFAQAATRMMSDTAFCHYVDKEVEQHFAEQLAPRRIWTASQPYRRIGWHNRNLIPWAGYWGPTTRCYVDQADYLWDAWFMSGYHRAKDVALAWAEQTKIEEADKIMRGPITAAENRGRWPANLQKQYIEMYEATWDPWFLAAAQAIADMHLWRFHEEGYQGHFWHAGYLAWQRYSGCPEHEEFIRSNVQFWSDWHQQGWAAAPTTTIPTAAFGYWLTGDEYYLRRAAGVADLAKWALYSGDEPSYYRGFYVQGDTSSQMLFASWFQTWFPLALGALERAGDTIPTPLPFAFDQNFTPDSRVAVRKQSDLMLVLRVQGNYIITGPDGSVYNEGQGPEVVIAAAAPAGRYTISLPGANRVTRLPMSPPGSAEVFIPAVEDFVAGNDLAQYWFYVPEGTESFWIDFENSRHFRQAVRQVIVWDPDGREVWAHRERAADYNRERQRIRADIPVAPPQTGRLWRVTLPGRRSMPFRLSPNLPRSLSHDPQRWFDG